MTEKGLKKLLEDGIEWPKELQVQAIYSRLHDDHDGTRRGRLMVNFSKDGDAWVETDGPRQPLRFRNGFGGGRSLRVNTALKLLALAIELDNAERPDP